MSHLISTTDNGQVFFDMPKESPCSNCGACCTHYRVSFPMGEIEGQGSNINVPADYVLKLNDFRAVMKGTDQSDKRCIALKGVCGQAGVQCSIYQNRPSVCREYAVWDEQGKANPRCNELRAKIGLTLIEDLSE